MREFKEILVLMFRSQDELNRQIDPEWEKRKFPWSRAIRQECAELINSLPWKWWTDGEKDWDNVRLEVVDVWHFWISWALEQWYSDEYFQEFFTYEEWASKFLVGMDPWLFEGPFRQSGTEKVIRAAEMLMHKTFLEVPAVLTRYLAILTRLVGLSFRDLAKLYFGKNVLNRFRWEVEKRDGIYQKVWYGREDNRFLAGFLERMEVPASREDLERFDRELKERFREMYPTKPIKKISA